MNILVIVVDLTKIGKRKIPTGFKDILDDSFKKSLAIFGKKSIIVMFASLLSTCYYIKGGEINEDKTITGQSCYKDA